eukprot:CAMPEP_0197661860 /NCGR_PEP_ID=MMETSP1338-20131121/51713_1 /TAXON_ID=43686 ORGANISM="Pelagodinium beii, Strain RCC1491" /NCGR_SAMPLE_ID=MMETSP1338 /ASSEMBLY_ACC=CAM_ASM_000754 /LENGTH=237 /DNA_ID=CAMNT_0043239501 /DNA_START=111 /DNA_END=824 /DNA_ORIENTATION=+
MKQVSASLLMVTASIFVRESLGAAFCGAEIRWQISPQSFRSEVAMNYRENTDTFLDPDKPNGVPNPQLKAARKMRPPQLENMDEEYWLIYIRSKKLKAWKPINVVSGAETAKQLKKTMDNDLARAVGADGFAEEQMVNGLAKQIYKGKDEMIKSASEMHTDLRWAKEFEFGYKKVLDNVKFNKDPYEEFKIVNVTAFKSEEEVRNVFDEASDAATKTQETVSNVGASLKGFLGNVGR